VAVSSNVKPTDCAVYAREVNTESVAVEETAAERRTPSSAITARVRLNNPRGGLIKMTNPQIKPRVGDWFRFPISGMFPSLEADSTLTSVGAATIECRHLPVFQQHSHVAILNPA
jgi:hypothetical protein